MKSYIITMLDNKKSVESTDKCIESGKKFGFHNIEIFRAITPEDDLKYEFEKDGLSIDNFKVDTRYSKLEPAMCCYLSHKELWKKCLELNETILVLEHDAIFIDKIPNNIYFYGLINLGKPSYGRYMEPTLQTGVFKLFSK